MIIDWAILLTQKLENKTYEAGYSCGSFILSDAEVVPISELKEVNLIEILTDENEGIDLLNLHSYIGNSIKVEIKTGDISNYFENIDDFIQGNKFECNLRDFYISEIDYRENQNQNNLIDNYKQNLKLISFLRSLSDNEKRKENGLELLFYKSGKGTDLIIDYDINELKKIETENIELMQKQLQDLVSGEDKKQLFVNELINFIEVRGKSYYNLAQEWNTLILNYNKSFSLFLAGFSFEKIKTSSNEHFQKLADKISESIGKASTYIFGVPVGYILLLNGIDYTGLAIGKNIVLLILGTIFFILIWVVLFENIKESIEQIEVEIDDFVCKIENVIALEEIKSKLISLKTIDIKKQRTKLLIVRILSSLIYLLLIAVYAYIFIDISIFYL